MRKIASLKNLEGDTVYPVTVVQAIKGLSRATESNHIYIDDTDATPSTDPSDFESCEPGDIYIYQEDETTQSVYMLTYITYSQSDPTVKELLWWKPLGGESVDPIAIAKDPVFAGTLINSNSVFLSTLAGDSSFRSYLLSNSSLMTGIASNLYFIRSLASDTEFTNSLLSNSSLMRGVANTSYFDYALLSNGSLLSSIATNSFFTNGNNSALFKAVGSNSYFKEEFLSNGSLLNGIANSSYFYSSLASNSSFLYQIASKSALYFTMNSYISSTLAANYQFTNSIMYNGVSYLSQSPIESGFRAALNGVSDWETIQTVNKGNSGDYIIDFSGLNLAKYKAIRIVFNAQCNESNTQTISIDLKHGVNTMTMYTSGTFVTGSPHVYEIIIEEDEIPKLFNGTNAPFKISCKNYSGQYGYGYETVYGGRAFSGTKANSLGNVTGIEFKKAYTTWSGENVWVILQGKAVK